jgi:hypothetical protein
MEERGDDGLHCSFCFLFSDMGHKAIPDRMRSQSQFSLFPCGAFLDYAACDASESEVVKQGVLSMHL